MHEIEIKLAFKDEKSLKKALLSSGAEFERSENIEDVYFSREANSLKEAKTFLRLRKKDNFCELTFKGELESEGNISKRKEINCEIKDIDEMNKILQLINYKVIRKNITYREYYKFENLEIVIVKILEPAKVSHLEIEGPSEESINEFRNKLGKTVSEITKDHFKALDQL